MAVGIGLIGAGNVLHSRAAHHHDRHAIPNAEDDAAGRRGPYAGEDVHVYAVNAGLLLL